jgi:hypothetical protein
MFRPTEQKFLANELIQGKILTSDLRAIRQYSKEHPDKPLGDIISAVLTSRTKRVYVLEFVFRGALTEASVSRKIRTVVGEVGLIGVERDGSFGRVILTPEGLACMRRYAAERGVTLANSVFAIINK